MVIFGIVFPVLGGGGNLLIPYRWHLYQILANEYGMAYWKISVGYGLAQLLIGISIFKIRPKGVPMLLYIYFSNHRSTRPIGFSPLPKRNQVSK
jgi:hypothetical protein